MVPQSLQKKRESFGRSTAKAYLASQNDHQQTLTKCLLYTRRPSRAGNPKWQTRIRPSPCSRGAQNLVKALTDVCRQDWPSLGMRWHGLPTFHSQGRFWWFRTDVFVARCPCVEESESQRQGANAWKESHVWHVGQWFKKTLAIEQLFKQNLKLTSNTHDLCKHANTHMYPGRCG